MWWAHTHIKELTLHSQRPKILAVSAARTLPKSPRSARGYSWGERSRNAEGKAKKREEVPELK